MRFTSVSKSQKVGSHNFRACLPLGQEERNANVNTIETAVANKTLFSTAILGHTSPISRGCGMTTKKSQACLKSWVFGYAGLHGNGFSLDLKKSKGL